MDHSPAIGSTRSDAGLNFWAALRGMGRRGDYEELLDRPDLDTHMLAENLRHIRLMNRGLGWAQSVWHDIWPLLPPAATVTLLDLATGSADVPRALVRMGRKSGGYRLNTVGSDVSRQVLTEAARFGRAEGKRRAGTVTLVQHDATALPFADGSFDIVTLCLAAHHFDPEPLQRVLAEMWRVARRGVIIGDLERSRPGYIASRLMALALRNRLTSHDGPISMLRAYTAPELRALATGAGLEHVRVCHPLPFRMSLTAHKLAGPDPYKGKRRYPYLTWPLDLARVFSP